MSRAVFPLLLLISFLVQEAVKPGDEPSDFAWALIILVVLFTIEVRTARSPFQFLGVTTGAVTVRMIGLVLVIGTLSNTLLFSIQERLGTVDFYFEPATARELFRAAFKGNVRTFGEELAFRGWLFFPRIRESARAFWAVNVMQALMFALVHASLPKPDPFRAALALYALFAALLWGWLNRRFNSLLPSWALHASSGLYHMLFGPR